MRTMRIVLVTLLLAALLGGAAFGADRAGWLDDLRAGGQPSHSGSTGPDEDAAESTSPSAEPSAAPSAEPSTEPEPTKPPPKPVLAPGAKGEQVRELQHRLLQIAWWSGTITDTYDQTTEQAVSGFQKKRGLKPTGVLDEQTWTRLTSMTRVPTHDEKHNILRPGPALWQAGDEGDEVRSLQARLKQIAWYSGDVTGAYDDTTVASVRGFQTKRAIPVTGEVDQRTLDRLVAMTHTPTHDEMHNIVPKPEPAPSGGTLDPRCLTGRALCVDKSTNSMTWVVDGKAVKSFEVRFGSDELPTREGAFSVFTKSRDHVSSLYDTSMPFAMFFSGGQAVHYSPDFAATGYNGASHGCINVRDYNGIVWLFDQVALGDKVIVYWS